MSKHTIPTTNAKRPIRSSSATCSRIERPLWGFKLRKMKRIAPATPPVGLCEVWLRYANPHVAKKYSQIDEEAPSPGRMFCEGLLWYSNELFVSSTVSRTYATQQRSYNAAIWSATSVMDGNGTRIPGNTESCPDGTCISPLTERK